MDRPGSHSATPDRCTRYERRRSLAPAGPGVPRPFVFPAITRVPLASGLDVRAVAARRGSGRVDRRGRARRLGRRSVDRAGLAAFAADLLDDGAGDLDGVGLADALARIGAELDVEVWPDAAVVSVTALARHAERAVALVADLLVRPRFADADVERVRGLRLDWLRQMRAQAPARADRAFVHASTAVTPTAITASGTPPASAP